MWPFAVSFLYCHSLFVLYRLDSGLEDASDING